MTMSARLLLASLMALAAPAAGSPDPKAQEVGKAFAEIVSLSGEVSLAAATVDKGKARFFLTQKMWREMETGEGTASPERMVEKLAAAGKDGKALGTDPGPFGAEAARFREFRYAAACAPGARSMRFLMRNRQGRLIAMAVVWNGEEADEARLAAPVAPLLALFAGF